MLHENDLAIHVPKKHNLHQTGLLFDNNKLNIAFGLILCYNLKMCSIASYDDYYEIQKKVFVKLHESKHILGKLFKYKYIIILNMFV